MDGRSAWMLSWVSIVALGASTIDPQLLRAVRERDRDTLVSLLHRHVDVNAAASDGATALAWAVHLDDLGAANLLIEAGANVHAATQNGATPLWLACSNGSAAMVERLLKAGADPNEARLPAGETALLRCARTGNVRAVNALLAAGAAVDARNPAGQTALMWALEERHPDVARGLIEHGADVNAVSRGGFTPMLFAARQGDVESGRLLLSKGAPVDAPVRVTEKEVSVAAPARLAAPAKGLLWFSDAQSVAVPLFLAIHSGREKFAVFLVEHGVNPNAVDQRGMTPLHYALQQGISDLDGALHDTRYAALDFLFRPNMAELVKVLLDRGADPNCRILKRVPPLTNNDRPTISLVGATPFLLAAATGDVAVMHLLLAKGADPSLTTDDGTTPLMAAAGVSRTADRSKGEEADALGAMKLIVGLGADVKAANKNGLTAMHGAAYNGANTLVEFLAERGAEVDVMDEFGETPLSIAAGDPNGLVTEFMRRAHEGTEVLLRKLEALQALTAKAAVPANQASANADRER
jgi:ankyrin repeat protein